MVEQTTLQKPEIPDPSRRPKLGIGVMILNQHDEVLSGRRLSPNNPAFHEKWQFPGGYQEYGESFEQTALREVTEECDADLQLDQIKFITVMNVLYTEVGYHNVGIFMFTRVDKDTFTFKNTEPEKTTDWEWIKWDDFIQKDQQFIPFKYFWE